MDLSCPWDESLEMSDREAGEEMKGGEETRKNRGREAWRPLHSSRRKVIQEAGKVDIGAKLTIPWRLMGGARQRGLGLWEGGHTTLSPLPTWLSEFVFIEEHINLRKIITYNSFL